MKTEPTFPQQMFRQTLEVVVIIAVALGIEWAIVQQAISNRAVCWLVMTWALVKTVFFFVENLQHILLATSHNIPYHRFLGLMGLNMAQITLSFALDYWCLETADPSSFSSFQESWNQAEILFECFFFSVLNFSFFGFGDVMPQTIPAKVVTLMQVILAFFTVIFLLSDFISLKDSLRNEKE
jgi:hypothetical protein